MRENGHLPRTSALPEKKILAGFDVVNSVTRNSPECSPLSCNSLAKEIQTNSHCLLPDFETDKAACRNGTVQELRTWSIQNLRRIHLGLEADKSPFLRGWRTRLGLLGPRALLNPVALLDRSDDLLSFSLHLGLHRIEWFSLHSQKQSLHHRLPIIADSMRNPTD